ncbi:hypothetical protein BpsM61_00023 [Bacillus phage vB_BpsM-61]|nr:hypothetical protein BpsM61_00023 [Bacillus phage vB_BpsM-61]
MSYPLYIDENMKNQLIAEIERKMIRERTKPTRRGQEEERKREIKEIEKTVRFYLMGWNKQLPGEWYTMANEIQRMNDPELAEYLRLKKKFEGDM